MPEAALHPVIRAAAPADIPAITAIYAHAVRHGTATFEIEAPDAAEMSNRFRALAEGGFPYLVAEIDGAVRGYAYAGPYRTRIAYRHTLEDSIYIAPDLHGRGIGRALIEPLLADPTARGFRQMIAVIGGFRAERVDCLTSRGGFPHGRDLRGGRLQVRPLARHRLDAAPARAGRGDKAAVVGSVRH